MKLIVRLIHQFTFLTCLLFAGITNAQTTIIKAGHVFDARTGKMLPRQTIVVKDGKIQQMSADIPYAATDKIIDLSDAWVLPGLMDCHVHMTVGFPYKKVAIEHMYVTESTALRALQGGEAARNVILGGAAAIEHGVELDDELLRLMKAKGTFLVGTDLAVSNSLTYGIDTATALKYYQLNIDRLKRAYKIGTPMAFGSDIIIDIPGKNRAQTILEVLQTWKDAQIPNDYLLQCMTIHAAELLGIAKERGVIAPSFFADMIAVKTNPLDTIDALKHIPFVMKEGKIIRQD